jgi:competence protein ComGC
MMIPFTLGEILIMGLVIAVIIMLTVHMARKK